MCMQYQVPQNISMEDRIIGPLTTIQFTIVVLGGGLAFIVGTTSILPDPFNKASGITLAVITLILALGKFNDQPMYRFFRHIFAFLFSPKIRVWHKQGVEVPLIKVNPQVAEKKASRTVKNVSKQEIARLAVVLDSRGTQGVLPKPNPPKSNGKK